MLHKLSDCSNPLPGSVLTSALDLRESQKISCKLFHPWLGFS